MRAWAIAALLVVLVAAPAPGQAVPSRPSADSIRPLDTSPSIPLTRPAIDTGSQAAPPAGSAGTAADPDAPVSSRDRIDPSAGAPAGADPSAMSGPAGLGADPGADAPYGGGVPERAAPPRTLRAHWHVFIAFAVLWVLLFGYAISVGRRFGRLEDEVRRLRGPAS